MLAKNWFAIVKGVNGAVATKFDVCWHLITSWLVYAPRCFNNVIVAGFYKTTRITSREYMLTFVKKSEEPFARSFVKARVRNRKKSKNKITFYLLCKIETLAFIDACVECSIETMPYGLNPHQGGKLKGRQRKKTPADPCTSTFWSRQRLKKF